MLLFEIDCRSVNVMCHFQCVSPILKIEKDAGFLILSIVIIHKKSPKTVGRQKDTWSFHSRERKLKYPKFD